MGPRPEFARSAAASLAAVLLSCAYGAPVFAQTAPAGQVAQAAAVYEDPGTEATVQSSRAYRIRQGDTLTINVFGEAALTPSSPVRVVQGGTIALPLVGDVSVGGKTTTQASEIVRHAMLRFVRDPHVTVAVYSVAPIEALVLGNVRVPGKYTLPPPARLTDVIAAAGGLGPTDGDLPTVRLESPEGTTSKSNLQTLLHDGDESQNVTIESGETVYIPSPAVFAVQVTGAVDHAGDVLMHEGDDVAVAIARAGSSGQLSPDLNHVTVTHNTDDGTKTVRTINLYPILEHGDFSHDIKVEKGDLVFVPTAPRHGSLTDILANLARFVPY